MLNEALSDRRPRLEGMLTRAFERQDSNYAAKKPRSYDEQAPGTAEQLTDGRPVDAIQAATTAAAAAADSISVTLLSTCH
ncbi:hypothetical protein [Kitasatospora sp. NPDC086791]|uniref:hypothetical protein n=1 Tax=Kitasatospora sp. NPDC086791 TaxID=3155178 RepID=UPI0034278D24